MRYYHMRSFHYYSPTLFDCDNQYYCHCYYCTLNIDMWIDDKIEVGSLAAGYSICCPCLHLKDCERF